MKALAIAATGVRRLLRDRSNIFFVFMLPMMLILVLGASFGSGAFDSRVGVVSPDSGELAQDLVGRMGELDAVALSEWENRDGAVLAVERGRLEAAVIIPDDYHTALLAGDEVTIEFVARPDASAQAIRNAIESVVVEQGSLLRAAALAGDFTDVSSAEALEVAGEVAGGARSLTVETEAVGEISPFQSMGQFELGAYSQLLLFVFLTSMTGSTALIETRRLGIASRMLASPTPVRTILFGEALARLGVALVQGLFIMLGSSLVFGVRWGDPLGAATIFLVFALGASGTAMLMGSLLRNEQQAGGIGVMLGIGLGAFGGAMVPLTVMEMFSPTLYRIAHITPHAWGIEAFETLILHGGTIADILPELGVLTAFAIVVYTLGAWRLRVTLTRS
ncbi:MAG: ABC transporter permease [Anaerosomatales bacterium]|nr:ABC transporter permease [Anaerosomatales bacterium]